MRIPALQHALRLFRLRPVFATFVVSTLALGLGGATAMFSVLDAVLLRPLPYPAADRLLTVWQTFPHWRGEAVLGEFWDRIALSWEDYQAARRAGTLDGLAVYHALALRVFRPDAQPEQIVVAKASASLLPLLGGRPALGRWLNPDEEGTTARNVVLLSHAEWLTRWNADPHVIGRTVRFNTGTYEIIGVMPRDFDVRGLHPRAESDAASFWIPIGTDPNDFQAFSQNYEVIARLAPGALPEAARAELQTLMRGQRKLEEYGVRVLPRLNAETGVVRTPLVLLAGAVALLLLLTCANVAALLLGEAAARSNEMATRAALGAGPLRLVRQLLAENMALSVLAALLGTVLALAGVRALLALAPASLPRAASVGLNPVVLGFAIGVTLLVAVAIGLAPALAARRSAGLASSASASRVTRSTRFEHVLLSAQVTFSMVLLASAALLVRSLTLQAAIVPGFETGNVLAVRVRGSSMPANEALNARLAEQLRRIRLLPGVTGATASTAMPFREPGNSWSIELNPEAHFTSASPSAIRQSVATDYFQVLGIPVLEGRALNDADYAAGTPNAAVVNRAFTQRFWPGRASLGRRFATPAGVFTIVGVVEDTRMEGLEIAPEAAFFLPLSRSTSTRLTFLVRTRGDARALAPRVHDVLAETDPELAVIETRTVTALIRESLADERYRTLLLLGFAGMAALIAALGLAGSTLRSLERRRRELCIRLSVGATPAGATRVLLGRAALAVLAGLAAGCVAALQAGHLMRAWLHGIAPGDPLALTLGAAVLLLSCCAAFWAPARRLWHTDIAHTLRQL